MGDIHWALYLAEEYHKGQRYGSEPYVNHLLRVHKKVLDANYGTNYQVVALLHDILEDTHCPHEKIKTLFGHEVWEAVRAMTHKKSDDYKTYIQYQVARNPVAKVVKYFDILDNLKHSYQDKKYENLQSKYENALLLLMKNW